MSPTRTSKGDSAAEKLVATWGSGACGYATHEALRARAINDQASERVWTEILDAIVSLQKAERHFH